MPYMDNGCYLFRFAELAAVGLMKDPDERGLGGFSVDPGDVRFPKLFRSVVGTLRIF